MVSPGDKVLDFDDVLSSREERDQYRRRVKEIIAESALMADIRRRRRIKPTTVSMLAQMHAQMEMLRIRAAGETKKLDDAEDRKTLQAQIRYLDGALRRSAKVLGLK